VSKLEVYSLKVAAPKFVEILSGSLCSSRIRFPMVSSEFFIDIILQAALWPHYGRTILVSGLSPGGKGSRCVGLKTLPLSSADCLAI